jgi:hypothetical protein
MAKLFDSVKMLIVRSNMPGKVAMETCSPS